MTYNIDNSIGGNALGIIKVSMAIIAIVIIVITLPIWILPYLAIKGMIV